jgi:Ca2+/Na+ antiporter
MATTPSGKGLNTPVFGHFKAWQVGLALVVLAGIVYYLYKKYKANEAANASSATTTAAETAPATDESQISDELAQIEQELADLSGAEGGSPYSTPTPPTTVAPYVPTPAAVNPGGPTQPGPAAKVGGNQPSAASKSYLSKLPTAAEIAAAENVNTAKGPANSGAFAAGAVTETTTPTTFSSTPPATAKAGGLPTAADIAAAEGYAAKPAAKAKPKAKAKAK